MVTQTLQRCYIWMIYRMSHTHTPIGHCPCLRSSFSTRASAQTLQKHTVAGHNLWKDWTILISTQGWADLAQQTVSCHDGRIKHGLFSDSPLHLRSWLNKQADFNGVPFTPPWPPLHSKTCTHTRQSTAPQRGELLLRSLALSVHLSVFLPSAQLVDLVFKF